MTIKNYDAIYLDGLVLTPSELSQSKKNLLEFLHNLSSSLLSDKEQVSALTSQAQQGKTASIQPTRHLA